MKGQWPPLLITLLILVVAAVRPAAVDDYVEGLLVDLRFRIRDAIAPPAIPEGVVIVAIDEASLAARGRWPWPRHLQAELLRRIFAGNPRVVGVDVFYPEPESETADRELADLLRAHRDRLVIALGAEVTRGRRFAGEVEEVAEEMAIERVQHLREVHGVEAQRLLFPPEPIASAATFGHVYTLPDRDGRLRWDLLYLNYGGEYIPSFSLQIARIALGEPAGGVAIVGGEGVHLGSRLVRTDPYGRLAINYLGREGSFPYLSAERVLSGDLSPSVFAGKIVLVGTSAIATYDMKSTPLSANMPGVEKNATVVANLVQGQLFQVAPELVDLAVVAAAGAAAIFLLGRASGVVALLSLSGLVGGLLLANLGAFIFAGVQINLTYPLLTLVADGSYIIGRRYLAEERRAREIRRMFASYVTERVVGELIRNPELARLGGERREITMLFSDIRSFTPFAEAHPPEYVVAMLNEYLAAMTEVVLTWEGTLDKFVGDAIVVFWGAPLRQEDHAERAVRCALHMLKRLGELQEGWRQAGQTPLDIGIGINTGEVLVGNIGAEGKKMDYTVIGDHVNLTARVESLTRRYDVRLLLTELTVAQIAELVTTGVLGHLVVRGLERVVVKGKARSIGVYQVESLPHGAPSSFAGLDPVRGADTTAAGGE